MMIQGGLLGDRDQRTVMSVWFADRVRPSVPSTCILTRYAPGRAVAGICQSMWSASCAESADRVTVRPFLLTTSPVSSDTTSQETCASWIASGWSFVTQTFARNDPPRSDTFSRPMMYGSASRSRLISTRV